jgi:hypothetical protein
MQLVWAYMVFHLHSFFLASVSMLQVGVREFEAGSMDRRVRANRPRTGKMLGRTGDGGRIDLRNKEKIRVKERKGK